MTTTQTWQQPSTERKMPPNIDYPAYTPPQYLLAGTGLSQDELIALYQGLRHSLKYIITHSPPVGFYGSLQDARATPELVFERLVGNVNGPGNPARSGQD